MSGEFAREVQVQVGSIAKVARQDEEGWSQQAEVRKEKDRLVKNGGPNVPSKPEECDCGRVSKTRGGPHWFLRDSVEVKPDIGSPAKSCRWEQEYRSVPSMRSPRRVEGDDQQEDKTGKGIPPTGSMFRGLYGQLQQSRVRPVVMSKEMRSV